MKQAKALPFTILIITLISISLCQESIQIMSQLNELRTIDLTSQFGIAVDNYVVESQSGFLLDQPLTLTQNDKFFGSSRTYVQRSQLEIDSQTTQQLQIVLDLSQREEERYPRILTLIQILKNNGQQTITEVSSLILTRVIQNADSFEAQLFAKNYGILSYTVNGQTFVSLISLDANQQLQISSGVQLSSPSYYLRSSFDIASQSVKFIVKVNDSNAIQLRTMNLQGQVSALLSQTTLCDGNKDINVNILPFRSGMLVICAKEEKFNYSYYFADINNNQIGVLTQSEQQEYDSPKTIAVNSINNVIYLVQTIQSYQNKIRLVELTLNKGNLIIYQQQRDIIIPINTINIQSCFIQVNGIITLISQDLIISVSMNSYSIVSQIYNQPINGYSIFVSNQYGDQIALQYVENDTINAKYTTRFIQTKLPQIQFRQKTATQQYAITYQKDTFQRSLTIEATTITQNSPAIIIINPTAYFLATITPKEYQVNMNIEKNFIGYVQNGSVTDELQNCVIQSLAERWKLDRKETPEKVYSTFSNIVLNQSKPNINNQYSITISIFSFKYNQQGIENAVVLLKNPILKVDEQSGFFLINSDTGAKQIYVFSSISSTVYRYAYFIIEPQCASQSQLLFSGDSFNNQVAVLCDKELKIYRFTQQGKFQVNSFSINYPTDKLVGTVAQIQLQPNGILYMTDNQRIIAIDINKNYFVGLVQIPSNQQGFYTGQVIFFSQSFVVARNDNNQPTIQQFSYNTFDGTQATLIRVFLNFGNTWTGTGFQAIRKYSVQSNEEFLIVDAITDGDIVKKLFYRVSGDIQAYNQLLTTINLTNNTPFFAIPTVVGYYRNQVLNVLELFYQISLQATINLTPQQFTNQISGLVNPELTLNGQFKLNLMLNYFRDVNVMETNILTNNENVINLQNSLVNNEIKIPYTQSFNDQQFTNGHLFGWQSDTQDINFDFQMQFTQRIVNQANASNKELQNQKILSQLIVMPNVMIISTSEGVFVEGLTLIREYQPNCQFYKQDGKLQISKSMGKTIIKQDIYSISKDFLSTDAIDFAYYQLQGTYDQDTNSKPELQILQNKQYSYNGSTLKNISILNIIQDPVFGLLALFQQKASTSSQVCQILLTDNADKSTFTFDCNVYQPLSNLLISNIFYIASADFNVFVSYNQKIYYNISNDLKTQSELDFGEILLEKGLQLYENSPMNSSMKLTDSSILISYLQGNIFQIPLDFSNDKLVIIQPIKTLYGQAGYIFTGSCFQNSDDQIFLLFQQEWDSSYFVLAMYEQYYISKNEYLIRGTNRFQIQKIDEFKNAIISNYNNQLIVGVSNYQDDRSLLLAFDINEQVKMNILQLKQFDIKNKSNVFNFRISPFYNENNFIAMKTLVNPGGNNTGSGSESKSILLNFSLILLIITFILL